MSRILSAVIFSGALFTSSAAIAQQTPSGHFHPPQDAQLHEQFYSHWNRPDGKGSCCNKSDCYPTKAEFREGKWWALRREDSKWLPIPKEVYDSDDPRMVQSPDGQAHLCAPAPNVKVYPPDYIFCFTAGMGI